MDQDFLSELDNAISHIGTNKVWKRTIGGLEISFSPIPYEYQLKINETIQNSDLGSAILAESKRVTLSYAIVGIDKFDFKEYRFSSPQFQIKGRDGGNKKVSLSDYLYHKMGKWEAQFIDDCFSVFADLMNSNVKENLKDIQFENLKDPLEEMNDLILRVAEIRDQLGLPHLVDPLKEPERLKFDQDVVETKDIDVPEPTPIPKKVEPETVSDIGLDIMPESLFRKINSAPPVPPPELLENPKDGESSTERPFIPKSSRSDDVIDAQREKADIQKLMIDRPPENKNPRFSQSR